jgi:hypothetical protein
VFDLLVDIDKLTEDTENSEPADSSAVLYTNVLACFTRLSGNTRFTAAAAGVALTHLMAIEPKTGVDERCRIKNVRTREGVAVPAQPTHYDVKYVNPGRRGHHLELALEAILALP